MNNGQSEVTPAWYEVLDRSLFHEVAKGRDNQREADFLCQALDLHPGNTLLDFPCGEGDVAVELASRGIHVLGVDRDPVSIQIATGKTQTLSNLRFEEGDLRGFNCELARFDAVLNWYGSFGYLATDAENSAALARLARHLRPSGRLLVDQINPFRVVGKDPFEVSVGTQRAHIEWLAESRRVRLEFVSHSSPHNQGSQRIYSLEEAANLFGVSGLKLVGVYGDFTGGAYSETSPRLIVVGRQLG
jgi:ubiquinone/menaquinone biosynthesis C-methylase UbiE